MSFAHCTVCSNVSISLCGNCKKLYNEPFTAYSANYKKLNCYTKMQRCILFSEMFLGITSHQKLFNCHTTDIYVLFLISD